MPITGKGTVYYLPKDSTEISRHCKMIYNTLIFFSGSTTYRKAVDGDSRSFQGPLRPFKNERPGSRNINLVLKSRLYRGSSIPKNHDFPLLD